MPDPFISRQDLTDYLGRDVKSDDGALIAIDAACEVCRTLAEQTFNLETDDVVRLDGTGTDTLLLPQLPVVKVTEVKVDGSAVTDYVLGSHGELFRGNGESFAPYGNAYYWPKGRQNVEVKYDHGYDDQDLPRDVRVVALMIAARLLVQGVAIREEIDQNRIQYAIAASDLTKGEQAILRKYRR